MMSTSQYVTKLIEHCLKQINTSSDEEHLTTYFEKVLSCIERSIYSVYIKEMNFLKILFLEKGVLFLPAS